MGLTEQYTIKNNNGYEDLANAIVIRAVEDLRTINRKIRECKHSRGAKENRRNKAIFDKKLQVLKDQKKKLLDFFYSDTYGILTKVPCETLIAGS